MSESQIPTPSAGGASRDDLMSARFAGLVLQQTNMALLLLGKVAHPESGETMVDMDSARMFIDQLEMLEFKTKGNLTADEEKLLSQSLTSLRLAFVEAADKEPTKVGQPASAASSPTSPPVEQGSSDTDTAPASSETSGEDSASRKKYSKSYGEA